MAGHAQLKCVMTECSKTQIRLTGPKWLLLSKTYAYFVVCCTYFYNCNVALLLSFSTGPLYFNRLFLSAYTVSFSYLIVTMNFNSHTTNKTLFACRLKPDLDHSIFLPKYLSSIKYDTGLRFEH